MAVLLGLVALSFAARIYFADECRVWGTETTIAADHRTSARFERVKDAILFNPASPGIRAGTPSALIRTARAEQEVKGVRRFQTCAKADWGDDNQSTNQIRHAHRYLHLLSTSLRALCLPLRLVMTDREKSKCLYQNKYVNRIRTSEDW